MSRGHIRIVRGGEIVRLHEVGPTETVLDYLRLREGATGTKEGCAEGDCGACTVAVGRLRGRRVHYEPINACIALLGTLDGAELVTVEDLAPPGEALHPVQQALVDHHGSQCGFCTPGFVMTLFTLYHARIRATRPVVNDWLAGNLCRCTGYRPIAAAAIQACVGRATDRHARAARDTASLLASIADEEDILIGDRESYFAAPATTDGIASLHHRDPDATLVAGATDVGLWVTKQLRELPRVIHLGRVPELHEVVEHPDRIELGAGATYAEAEAALGSIDPDVAEVLRRLGSKQVRAAGTVGGNIANGSPIGDTPPILIALGATLELRHGTSTRALPIEDFFIDYGHQDRVPGELVTRILVPRLAPGQHLRCYKISKRFDQDISALLGAFRLTVEGRTIREARIAFGGMAATPRQARAAQACLTGMSLDDTAGQARAVAALGEDFQPIDDLRASAAYRIEVAGNLLVKALEEIAGAPSTATRVVGRREPV